jgi:hypothetical protein
VIIGNTQQAAERLLGNIRDELSSNEAIREDFGEVKGDTWQSAHAVVLGSTIRAYGTGNGAIRGVTSPGQRPSLIIADDLDDDALVRSPTQLESAIEWWSKAVMSLGDNVGFTTSYVAVGTIIRRTSLLQSIIDSPDFTATIESGVTSFAVDSQLWESWEASYLALARAGAVPSSPADDAFYVANRDALLVGAAVLWPRDDAYYHLMVTRLSRGRAAFASEVQNAPSAGDSHLGSVRRIGRADIEAIAPRCELLAGLDPTIRGGKRNDLAAFVEVLFDPTARTLIVDYADCKQRNYTRTVSDVTKRVKARGRPYDGFWCESNTPVVSDLLQQSLAKAGSFVAVVPVWNTASKDARIEALAEYSERGQLLFADDIADEMVRSFEEWPNGRFDDPIDAVAIVLHQIRDQGRLDLFPLDPSP